MSTAALAEEKLPLPRRVAWGIALYAGAMSIYFGAGMAARPPFARLRTPLDDAIPFVPELMIGYALAYVVPFSLLVVEVTDAGMRRMSRAVLLAYVMAASFFVAMPVQDADPPLEAGTWSERLLDWNRQADTSKNAFPSMHVGLAVLLALIARRRSRRWGLALSLAAAAIALSTVFVKQHFLLDIPAGALVGWLACRIVYGAQGEAAPG